MKKILVIIFFLILVSFFLFREKALNTSPVATHLNYPSTQIPSPNIPKANLLEKKAFQKPNLRSPASYLDIKTYLPSNIPSSLKNRWEQRIAYEDNRYVTSQLYLDGRPLGDYFFKWEKQATELNLVAGELPEIKGVAASFPSKGIQSEKINDVLQDKANLLSSKEIWIVSSSGILLPFLKIEIQRIEKPQRTNGHEFWIYDILKDTVTKIVQADRY